MQVVGYVGGEAGLVLVAVVEQVAWEASDDALSPFLKPL